MEFVITDLFFLGAVSEKTTAIRNIQNFSGITQ